MPKIRKSNVVPMTRGPKPAPTQPGIIDPAQASGQKPSEMALLLAAAQMHQMGKFNDAT